MPSETAYTAAQGMANFLQAANSGRKIMWGPFHDTVNLAGLAVLANPTTLLLPTQDIDFFQVSQGQTGGGFASPKTFAETNMQGTNGQMTGNMEFIAQKIGPVWYPQLSIATKDHLDVFVSMSHRRLSHRWEMGAARYWPSGEFGHSSPSVETTVANTTIQYGVNGHAGLWALPDAGFLYFPRNQIVKVTLTLNAALFVTVDGLTWNGGIAGVDPGGNGYDPVPGARVGVTMFGWQFESLTN